ncbi:hypothetical protein B0H21DRAFT_96614 [Amylocystis lapponica]|nr:hypothetical protein B0H21DRAFT_96614 [Amylocystis lapponica]
MLTFLKHSPAISYTFTRQNQRRLPLLLRWTSKRASKAVSRLPVSPADLPEEGNPPAIQTLLYTLKKYLAVNKDSNAVNYFHAKLSKQQFDGPTRSRAYIATISLLLRRGYALSAAIIHSSMTADGYIPPATIRTQMRIVSMANSSPSEAQLLDAMRPDFLHASYDEPCLRDLIRLLAGSMNCEPKFIDAVVGSFLETRAPDYTLSAETINLLVHVHARARSSKTARQWISIHAQAISKDEEPSSGSPYTTLLRDLAKSDPEESMTYNWILENVKAENILPDLAFYNALITAEIRRNRYDRAFAIYNSLIEHRSQSMTPDAYTYGTLFRALRRFNGPRNVRTRRSRSPRNMPTPRALYRELLTCHFLQTNGCPSESSPVINENVLHSALRTLLTSYDYPAAFLVLRTFRTCRVPVTLRTYRFVVAGLLARIELELPQLSNAADPTSYWTYRFLGLATFPVGHAVNIDHTLLELILRFGTEGHLTLAYIPPPPQGTVRPLIPTVQRFLSGDRDTNWKRSILPLERILRRAIYAERLHSVLAPAKEVSMEITEAKAEMFDPVWFPLRQAKMGVS